MRTTGIFATRDEHGEWELFNQDAFLEMYRALQAVAEQRHTKTQVAAALKAAKNGTVRHSKPPDWMSPLPKE